MGRIAKLLSFVRVIKNSAKISDVQVDPGGGANVTVEHFAPPGDDSYPLTTDRPFIINNGREGGESAVGYIDPVSDPVATEGDKRIYGRSPIASATVNQVWLQNDGTILISNDNGSLLLSPDGAIKGDNNNGVFELQSGGNFVVNTVIIDTDGNISTNATVTATTVEAVISLTVDTKEMDLHVHDQAADSSGDTQQNTGPPV